MKGTCLFQSLNNSGLYISEIDEDDIYKSKSNPRGSFVMIIEPFYGGEIYFNKVDDGYLVCGEGYIVEARKDILNRKIERWRNQYNRPQQLNYINDNSLQI